MHLDQAEQLALALLQQHGLSHWKFSFDHARRRFGMCHVVHQRISLSRSLTLLNEIEQVRDTLLHEIAHALTPGAGHGPRWQAQCVAIGARPQRCFTSGEVRGPLRSPPRPEIGCVRCDWWADRRRRDRGRKICVQCRQEVFYREKSLPP